MKNKAFLLPLAMLGASLFTTNRNYNDGSLRGGIPDKPLKIIPNGCKEYTIEGVTVVAISEKSARKKVERLLKNK